MKILGKIQTSDNAVVTNLNADTLDGYSSGYFAPLANPVFTGTVKATTATLSDVLTLTGGGFTTTLDSVAYQGLAVLTTSAAAGSTPVEAFKLMPNISTGYLFGSKILTTSNIQATDIPTLPATKISGVTALYGSNTGDETLTTLKAKLGITTLSGPNTGDQTITLTGDVTGSGTGSFATTLATLTDSGIGTFKKITTNNKGLVTGTALVTQSDITGLLGAGSITSTMLADSGITAGIYNNSATSIQPFTVDAKGRITATGASVTITPAWSSITSKPTTLAEYGITDIATSSRQDITTRIVSGFYRTASPKTSEGYPYTDTNSWCHMISNTHTDLNNYFAMQLAANYFSQDLYYRSTVNSGNTPWNKVLHSGNYNNYTPTLTGTGAIGTWGISITGNAATATYATTAGRANSMYASDIMASLGLSGFSGGYIYASTGIAGTFSFRSLSPSDVSLGNVDNTSDLSKPVSTAQQNALNLKANLASPTFTGTLTSDNVTVNSTLQCYNIYKAGGTAPAYYMNQDGTGRQHWYWNTSGGVSPTFSVAGEDACDLMHHVVNDGSGGWLQFRTANGFGKAAGSAISWTEVLFAHSSRFSYMGNTVLHSGNYNTYTPTLTGIGAIGTWNITATNASNLTGVAGIAGYSSAGCAISYASVGGPQIMANLNGASMLSFHRPNLYAVNFGLDTDNQLKIGGWSMGGVSYPILHTGNFIAGTHYVGHNSAATLASLQVSGTINSSAANVQNIFGTSTASISIGNATNYPYIDFNCSNIGVDYNARISCSGASSGTGGGTLTYDAAQHNFTGTVSGITKAMVGLSSVDNTSDINKPISTAQQNALNLKANLDNPTFTGTVVTGDLNISTRAYISPLSVDVGGTYILGRPTNSTNLRGNIRVDINNNRFRIYDDNGLSANYRGAYLDIPNCYANVGSEILTSTNYHNYIPTFAGTGATGTWGISITGNAEKLGGLSLNTTLTNNIANQVVRTDGNGYLQTGWISTLSGNADGNSPVSRIYASYDSYIRYYSAQGFIDAMGLVYGGNARGRAIDKSNGSANTSDSSNSSGFYFGNTTTGMPDTGWWLWLTCAGNLWSSSDGYAYQLASSFWSDDFRIRRMQTGNWKPWVSLWHSGNFNPANYYASSNPNNYITSSASITGSSASCTGNAATATYATTAGRANSMYASDIMASLGLSGFSGGYIYASTGIAGTFTFKVPTPSEIGAYPSSNPNNYITSSASITGSSASCTGNAATATYATTAGSASASDVYLWAKAATKPTYTAAEVGAYASSNPAGYTSNVGTVTNVIASAITDNPISIGGTSSVTPTIYCRAASSTQGGYLSASDKVKLDGIATGATNVTNTNQLTNGAGYITSTAGITSTEILSSLGVKSAGMVLAAPGSSAGITSFRYLVESDLTFTISPTKIQATSSSLGNWIVLRDVNGDFSARFINADLTGNAATATTITSVLPISKGGTGSSSSTAALSALGGSRNPNLIFASPDGSAGSPTFRGMTLADLPSSVVNTSSLVQTGSVTQTKWIYMQAIVGGVSTTLKVLLG